MQKAGIAGLKRRKVCELWLLSRFAPDVAKAERYSAFQCVGRKRTLTIDADQMLNRAAIEGLSNTVRPNEFYRGAYE